MLYIHRYKITLPAFTETFLVYSKTNEKIPEDIKEVSLVQENISKKQLYNEYSILPIYSFDNFMLLFLPKNKSKNRDKKLMRNGIVSWYDLTVEYYLIRYATSAHTKKMQNMIIDKYSEIINEL